MSPWWPWLAQLYWYPITLFKSLQITQNHRHLKSPHSLPSRSLYLTLITRKSWSCSWMTNSHPFCSMLTQIGTFLFVQCHPTLQFLRCSYNKIDLENPWSRPWPIKVKCDGHIWGLEFNWYVCFSFHSSRTIFGSDIPNSIFDLENWRSRSWRKSNQLKSNQVIYKWPHGTTV